MWGRQLLGQWCDPRVFSLGIIQMPVPRTPFHVCNIALGQYCIGTSSSQVHSFLSVAFSTNCCAIVTFFAHSTFSSLGDSPSHSSWESRVMVSLVVPIGQSICGLIALKKGYPRMRLSSPISVTRNRWFTIICLLFIVRSAVSVTPPNRF